MSARRLPPKAERRALLRERGWYRLGPARGAETWCHERYLGFFSLAIAYRVEAGLVSGEFLRELHEAVRP